MRRTMSAKKQVEPNTTAKLDMNALIASQAQVNKDNNHIYFYDDVETESVLELRKAIQEINQAYDDLIEEMSAYEFENKEAVMKRNKTLPIYLHINSPGGSMHDGLLAYDIIKHNKYPIITSVEGEACSAASLMSIAGTKRYITPSSYILIHQLSTKAVGTYAELKDELINVELFMERIRSTYVESTKIKREDIDKILSKDYYWDAKTCLEHGLVDEVKII